VHALEATYYPSTPQFSFSDIFYLKTLFRNWRKYCPKCVGVSQQVMTQNIVRRVLVLTYNITVFYEQETETRGKDHKFEYSCGYDISPLNVWLQKIKLRNGSSFTAQYCFNGSTETHNAIWVGFLVVQIIKWLSGQLRYQVPWGKHSPSLLYLKSLPT
jgi:hypothetical protein